MPRSPSGNGELQLFRDELLEMVLRPAPRAERTANSFSRARPRRQLVGTLTKAIRRVKATAPTEAKRIKTTRKGLTLSGI